MKPRMLFSARAWCPPTGTEPRPTTAGSFARCMRGATMSPFTSPTHTSDRRTATSRIRRWAKVVVYPADGEDGVARAARAGARTPTSSSRRAGSGCSTRGWKPRPGGEGVARAGDLLGRRRAGDARAAAPIRPIPSIAGPAYDLVLTYGGGEPVVEPTPRRRPALRPDLQRSRSSDPLPGAARSALRGRPRLPRQPPARPRSAGRRVLPCRGGAAAGEFLLGGNGWDDKPMTANVRRVGHLYTATTTPSTARRERS